MSDGAPEQVRTRADLGRELTALRGRGGLSLRQLARQIDAPLATVGDYFAGRHLPGPSQLNLYRSILTACGVTDQGEVRLWLDALNRARFASDGRAARAVPPYRGLEPFHDSDHHLFFGRDAAVTEVLDRLRTLAADPGLSGGVMVVVAPSGSGKSSLLAAGVVPAVRAGTLDGSGELGAGTETGRADDGDQEPDGPGEKGGWMSPTAAGWECAFAAGPDASLQALEHASAHPGRRPLLILDQFEDVLALPAEDQKRKSILDHLTQPAGGRLAVVALRADFYQMAAAEPALLPALRHAQFLLGPMTEEELRAAIAGPAHQVGVTVEDGLVELVLSDLAPHTSTGFAHDAGALPLLSHVLLATWERANRNELTVADYREVGGIRGAISQSAEDLYAGLTPAERDLARRIFSRLVRVAEDSPVTRRRAERVELDGLQEGTDGEGLVAGVVERFVAARLLTADATTISISHDALITTWPRLAEWINSDRAGLRLHHQLSDAAIAWAGAGRDESLLWRGSRLDMAEEWAAEPGHEEQLNRAERTFLSASTAARNAQARAARRRTRRMKELLLTVCALAAAVSVLAAYALDARAGANNARDQALSRQVAIEAHQVAASQPAVAAQLALAAYRESPTVQARSTLIDATAGAIPTRLLGPQGPVFLATDAPGTLMAAALSAADAVQLYTLAGGRLHPAGRVTAGPASDQNFAVALSPDGRLLAAGGTGDTVTLWNVATPGHPFRLATLSGMANSVYSLAFDSAGAHLAAASADGTVHQWDVVDPARPTAQPTVHAPGAAALHSVAYSPNGQLMAAAGDLGTLLVWATGTARATVVTGAGSDYLESVSWSPDGRTVVTGGDDQMLRVFRVTAAGGLAVAHTPISGTAGRVLATAFSPDGRTLAASSADGSIRFYNTSSWETSMPLDQPNPVTALAYTPDGRALITGDTGGTTRLWPLPLPGSYTAPGSIFFMYYSGNGHRLAVVSGGSSGRVDLWNTTDPMHPTRTASVTPPAGFGPVAGAAAVSPNGRLLAVADDQARVQLMDITEAHHPRPIGAPLTGNKPLIEQIAFSPSGTLLAACDDSGQVRLWDVSDPTHPRSLPALVDTKGELVGIAFSPDGRLLADAGTDFKVRLWDLSDLEHPRRLATLGGFSNYVYSTAFTPDGRTLIAGSADSTVRLWDLSDPGHPRPLGKPITGPTGYVYQLQVSPDGRNLAGATTHGEVWLWDISHRSKPKVLAELTAAKDAVFAVAFSPTARVLAAGGSDRTLHFWNYSPAGATKLVCAAGGSPITRSEWAEYVQGKKYSPPCPT